MSKSVELLREMVRYNAPDLRRINHALKVHGYACMLGQQEGLPEKEQNILELAAALHDIGIHEAERKYGSSAGVYQEKEGPAIARKMLETCGVQPDVTDRVCTLIGRHHTYAGIDGMDCQLLIEADFLVNIEEDGLSESAVRKIRETIFRSAAGKATLDLLFLSPARRETEKES